MLIGIRPPPTDCLHSGRVVCQEHTAKNRSFTSRAANRMGQSQSADPTKTNFKLHQSN